MTGRIWVVSELYHPEETSTGWFLSRIAEGLAEDGSVAVHAICSRPTYSQRGLTVPWFERYRGVDIHRMRSTRFAKDNIAGRLVNLVSFSLAAFVFALLRVRRGDRLLVVTNPPSMPFLMGLVSRLRAAPAALLVHDVYPEVLVATGMISPSGLAQRMIGAVTGATYRLYSRVVVLGRDMRDVVGARIRSSRTRLVIIPNWGDVDEIVPLDHADNAFAQEHSPVGACVIQFAGNLGRTHNVEAVLDAAHELADEPGIAFQFIGEGGKAGLLGPQGAGLPGNVKVLPRQPRALLNGMLAGATASIIAFVPGMRGVSVPSRMYNIMAAGTAIIAMADAGSELSLVIEEEGCGWRLEPDDSAGLVALVRHLATPAGQEEAHVRGAKGREAAVRRFSLPVVQAGFRQMMQEI